MYVIDASGNALIDTSIQDEVDKATRDRTLSPRAEAFINPRSISLTHLTRNAEHGFATKVSQMVREVALRLGLITKAVRANEGVQGMTQDARSMMTKIMTRAITRGLAGYPGVVPIIQYSGWDQFRVILPADGAVIRYLRRCMRNSGCTYLNVTLNHVQEGDSCTTVDGHSVMIRPSTSMYVMVVHNQPNNGRTNASANAMLRALEISKLSEGFVAITRTLARRCMTTDGSWGEAPKFPIMNFSQKAQVRPLSTNLNGYLGADSDHMRHQLSGNNQALFGDKSVYHSLDMFAKSVFSVVHNREGAMQYEWKDPRRS